MSDITAKPGDDIRAKLATLSAGDDLVLDDGAYALTDFHLKGGTGIRSKNVWKAELTFTTAKDKFAIYPDGAGVRIKDLSIKANNGIIRGDNLDNTTIQGNRFQWGYDGTYYNRHAILGYGHANGLNVRSNLFVDSPSSDRNLEIWGWSNGSYSFNEFYNVQDGGHIMNPGDNLVIEGNVGERVHRMPGGEYQQNGYPPNPWPKSHKFINNIFYNPEKPYWDSMGVSYPLAVDGVLIAGNYWDMRPDNGVYGVADSSGNVRGSYGIEGPQTPSGAAVGVIENNVIISGRSVAGVSAPGQKTAVRNNKFYGGFAWGVVGGEPGAQGQGTPVDTNNLKEADLAKAPKPSKRVTKTPYGQTSAPTPPPPPPPPPPTMPTFTLSVVAISDTQVRYQWSGLPAGTAKLRLSAITHVGLAPGPMADLIPAPPSEWTLGGFTKNWNYDFAAVALNSAGVVIAVSADAPALKDVKVIAPINPPPPPPPPLSFVSAPINIKRSDGTTAPYDVPIENGQFNLAKATLKP